MEKLILPEEVLSRQICMECFSYLSVGPVMVSREGKVICGRCSQSVETGFQQSLYNLFAKNLVFKCINYHAGCGELLRFNEALEHEEQCKKNMTNCLTCPFCNYEGNGCQLIRHIDNRHMYRVVEDNFKIINEDKFLKNVIFVKNGCIFCITVFVESDVRIYNLLVASDNAVSFSNFKLKFFDVESNVETTPIRVNLECKLFPSNSDLNSAVDTNANYSYSFIFAQAMLTDCFPLGSCFCKIELIDKNVVPEDGYFTKIIEEIDRNMSNTRIKKSKRDVDFYIDYILNMPTPDLIKLISSKLYASQRCGYCMAYVTDPVYFCPKYHIACGSCTRQKCSNCKACCQWNCKSRLHNISLQCEWSSCTVRTDIFDFIRHKQDCKFRRYKCPDRNCNFIGYLSGLTKHWHLNPLIENHEIPIDTSIGGRYWLNTKVKDLFYVTFDHSGSKKSLVSITILNTIMYKNYKFTVCKNKTYGYGNVATNLVCGNKSGNFVQYIYTDNCAYLTTCKQIST